MENNAPVAKKDVAEEAAKTGMCPKCGQGLHPVADEERYTEEEFLDKMVDELPGFGIDTSRWEYDYGDNAYSAMEFLSRIIKASVADGWITEQPYGYVFEKRFYKTIEELSGLTFSGDNVPVPVFVEPINNNQEDAAIEDIKEYMGDLDEYFENKSGVDNGEPVEDKK